MSITISRTFGRSEPARTGDAASTRGRSRSSQGVADHEQQDGAADGSDAERRGRKPELPSEKYRSRGACHQKGRQAAMKPRPDARPTGLRLPSPGARVPARSPAAGRTRSSNWSATPPYRSIAESEAMRRTRRAAASSQNRLASAFSARCSPNASTRVKLAAASTESCTLRRKIHAAAPASAPHTGPAMR